MQEDLISIFSEQSNIKSNFMRDKSKQKKKSVFINKSLCTRKADNVAGMIQDMGLKNPVNFSTPAAISEETLDKTSTWIHPQLSLDIKKRMVPKFRTVSTLCPFPYPRRQFKHQV